jgi:short subunit dehydrogenase-like uncharacterized protein
MLYGANGYTGKLIIEEALRRGLRPVLAGRSADAIRPLAEKYGLECRVFDLATHTDIVKNLAGMKLLLLAAGPFSATSTPALKACLEAGVHYLDITGEVSVFEAAARRDQDAKSAGIVVMPGVGFDVVPSDCLAAALHAALPTATHLQLAFAAIGRPSPGTAKTMVEGLPHGGAIRKEGKLEVVPPAWKVMRVPFRRGARMAMTIPWGDVATAYRSTGIPNIEVYMAVPPALIRGAKLYRPFRKLLGLQPVQAFLKRRAGAGHGPTEEQRRKGRSLLWGRVTDPSGKSAEGQLETLEGYDLTAQTATDITLRVLNGDVKAGYTTPAMAFGPDYIRSLPDTTLDVTTVP